MKNEDAKSNFPITEHYFFLLIVTDSFETFLFTIVVPPSPTVSYSNSQSKRGLSKKPKATKPIIPPVYRIWTIGPPFSFTRIFTQREWKWTVVGANLRFSSCLVRTKNYSSHGQARAPSLEGKQCKVPFNLHFSFMMLMHLTVGLWMWVCLNCAHFSWVVFNLGEFNLDSLAFVVFWY